MTERIARNEARLRSIYSGEPGAVHGFICSGTHVPLYENGLGDFTLSEKPVKEWVPWLVENYRRDWEMMNAVDSDCVPYVKLSTGTHIYAHAFGSPIKTFENDNPCALPFISTPEDADALEVPDIWSSPVLSRIFEMGHAIQEECGQDVFLGPPDMQSGFDTACLIWDKTALYCSMMVPEERAAVMRLVDKCARLFSDFVSALRDEFPRMQPCHCPHAWVPPEMPPWLSNDECGAVSQDMFAKFMLPELIEFAERFGGMGMHCCADAEYQFELFKKIPHFYAFNRVASRQGWTPLIDHFSGTDAPVHVISWIDDDATKTLLEKAPSHTRFIFAECFDSVDKAASWLDQRRRWGEEL